MTLSKDARILWQTAEALALKSRAVSPMTRQLPPLLFLTDPERTSDPVETVRRLPVGSAVIYRHFGAVDAYEVATQLRDVTTDAGVLLLIGLDEALAEAVEADGVHLPERALGRAKALKINRPEWILIGAAHSFDALFMAEALDAALVSPVFRAGGTSASKPELGIRPFSRMCALSPRPVYGLGGINAVNAPRLIDTGACGIAGVDAVQTAFRG